MGKTRSACFATLLVLLGSAIIPPSAAALTITLDFPTYLENSATAPNAASASLIETIGPSGATFGLESVNLLDVRSSFGPATYSYTRVWFYFTVDESTTYSFSGNLSGDTDGDFYEAAPSVLAQFHDTLVFTPLYDELRYDPFHTGPYAYSLGGASPAGYVTGSQSGTLAAGPT